jgi:hypothetical protein
MSVPSHASSPRITPFVQVSPSKRRRDYRGLGLDKPIEIILSTLFIHYYTSKSLLSDGSYKQVVDVPFLYSKGTVLKTMTALK